MPHRRPWRWGYGTELGVSTAMMARGGWMTLRQHLNGAVKAGVEGFGREIGAGQDGPFDVAFDVVLGRTKMEHVVRCGKAGVCSAKKRPGKKPGQVQQGGKNQ